MRSWRKLKTIWKWQYDSDDVIFLSLWTTFFLGKENVLWEFSSGNSESSVEIKLTGLLVKLISFLYLVGSAAPFHTKESANRKSFAKGQPSMGCLNPLDSTAPKVKRGKEREIAKLKRPTALKKVNMWRIFIHTRTWKIKTDIFLLESIE